MPLSQLASGGSKIILKYAGKDATFVGSSLRIESTYSVETERSMNQYTRQMLSRQIYLLKSSKFYYNQPDESIPTILLSQLGRCR